MRAQRRQFVLAFMAYLIQRDLSPEQVGMASGLNVDSILAEQDIEISDVQLHGLWNAATQLTGDPLFGLHLGESFQLAAIGVVGEIIRTSKTVGEALSHAANFTPVVTTDLTIDVSKANELVTIRFVRMHHDSDPAIQQITDFLVVFTVHELNGFLLRKISPRTITYPFRVEASKEYERIFQSVPRVNGDLIQIEFDGTIWDTPIITADFETQRILLEKLTAGSTQHSVSFQTKILDYLLKNSFHGILSLEDVAANFNITARSLQRRLQDEGTTFQQIADSVRKTLALHYIEGGQYKMKEISHLLGYNEVSAFSRAFKRWTGTTPVRYNA